MTQRDNLLIEPELSGVTLWSPYHALLGTMLRNAVEEACLSIDSGRMKDRLVSRAARRWFSSEEVGSPETGITFVWVCEHLGLSPEAVRGLVYRLISKRLKKAPRRRAIGNFT